MPYIDTCPKCKPYYATPGMVPAHVAFGWPRCKAEGRDMDERVPCPQCRGTGRVKPYRVVLTIEAADDHGWRDTPILSWPDFGDPGWCRGCGGGPLPSARRRWCDDPQCRRLYYGRLYTNVHWQKRHVVVRDGPVCYICGARFESPLVDGGPVYPEPHMLELEHVVPLSQGGTEAPDNLRVACAPCHRIKSAAERSRAV